MLSEFDDGCFDQCFSYKSGQWPGRTVSFIAYHNGEPTAGAVVVMMTPPVIGRGISNVRFGPFWRRRDHAASMEDYQAVIGLMIEEFAVRRGQMLSILPRPSHRYAAAESQCLENLGFSKSSADEDENRYLVDLRLSEDDQMASLSQKWRYNLRRGLRNDLTYREMNDRDGCRAFKTLHDQMQSRKGLNISDDVALVEVMQAALGNDINPRVHFIYEGDKPLAGAVTMSMGDTAYYVFGASADEALAKNAGYVLQWNILNSLRGQQAVYYDLGGESQDRGLRQFKRGLTGRAGIIVPMTSEYQLHRTTMGYLGGNLVQFVRSMRKSRGSRRPATSKEQAPIKKRTGT